MPNYTDMKLDEVIVSDHAHYIKLAEDGCVNAAKSLMADAAICIQYGIPLPEPLASYIGQALYTSAWHPENISKDFNLKRDRGKNKYDADFRTHLICLEVQLAFFDIGHYTITTTGDGAYQAVADEYELSETYVRNLFEKNHERWHVKESSLPEVKSILPGYRKLFR